MEPLQIDEVRILTKHDLYSNYPFPYDFASTLVMQSSTTLSSNSLKTLLFSLCFISFEENTTELLSQDELFNQDYETFFCMDAYFIVKNGVLYYLDFKSKIYFNLENLNYQDILISSIMYIVVQHQKEYKLIPWLVIHKFLLQLKSPYTTSLCCFLKKTLCMKTQRKVCIINLIANLELQEKKSSKQNILAILDLIEIDFNKANLLANNYTSIFNNSSVLINFLEEEIE